MSGEANTDYLRDKPDQINFAKRSRVAESIQSIQMNQATPYNLTAVPALVKWIAEELNTAKAVGISMAANAQNAQNGSPASSFNSEMKSILFLLFLTFLQLPVFSANLAFSSLRGDSHLVSFAPICGTLCKQSQSFALRGIGSPSISVSEVGAMWGLRDIRMQGCCRI
jgi:hypothetical protein